jgi:RHS repeat-associated protein
VGSTIITGYDYDAAGNRTRTTVGGATTATYEYDKLDRLLLLKTATGAISEEYGYNPRGNLAQIKADGTIARTFQWDGADRMIGATAGGTTLGMRYDVDGRRVQLSASGVITNYLWDITTRYGDVLLETGTNGAFKTSYVYGNACGSGCSRNPVAELISQKRGANPREYYLLDGQGSVRGLTGDTGTLTQEYAYDTAGSLTSGDATKSAYLYTGQQYDAATELYSLRARYYSPQQGRFLSMDKWPVSRQNPMELNRYGYTANNPLNLQDPSGNSALGEKLTLYYWRGLTARQGVIFTAAFHVAILYAYTIFSILYLAIANGSRDCAFNPWSGTTACGIVYRPDQAVNIANNLKVLNLILFGLGLLATGSVIATAGLSAPLVLFIGLFSGLTLAEYNYVADLWNRIGSKPRHARLKLEVHLYIFANPLNLIPDELPY